MMSGLRFMICRKASRINYYYSLLRGAAASSTPRRMMSTVASSSSSTTTNNNNNNLFGNFHFPSSSSSSSSVGKKNSSPWLMLHPDYVQNDYEDRIFSFYSIAEDKLKQYDGCKKVGIGEGDVEVVSSSHGWIFYWNTRKLNLYLSNPILPHHPIINLPPIPSHHTLKPPGLKRHPGYVRKLITSCSPLERQDCRVIMSYGPHQTLAFTSLNNNTDHWTTPNDNNNNNGYQDFVYSNKQKLLYCITKDMCFESWDLHDIDNPVITRKTITPHGFPLSPHSNDDDSEEMKQKLSLCKSLTFLVVADKESGEDIFWIRRHVIPHMAHDGSYDFDSIAAQELPYKTIGFDVYKYDPENNELVYMDKGSSSLDGLALFIGNNHSFALPAGGGEEYPELKPNSIYYADVHDLIPPKWVNLPFGGHDIGIFNYQDQTFSDCYYGCDIESVLQQLWPAPMWFTPTTTTTKN